MKITNLLLSTQWNSHKLLHFILRLHTDLSAEAVLNTPAGKKRKAGVWWYYWGLGNLRKLEWEVTFPLQPNDSISSWIPSLFLSSWKIASASGGRLLLTSQIFCSYRPLWFTFNLLLSSAYVLCNNCSQVTNLQSQSSLF